MAQVLLQQRTSIGSSGMNLQWRLTLTFAALLGLLGLAAGWWQQRLTGEMRNALAEAASSVGHQLVTVLRAERSVATAAAAAPTAGPASAIEPAAGSRQELRVVVNGRELSPEEIARLPERPRLNWSTTAGPQLQFEVEQRLDDAPRLWMHGADGLRAAIPLPAARLDAALGDYRQRLAGGLLALLVAGTLLAALLARRIAAPLARLADAARRLGAGELGVQAVIAGPPEVRQSIAAFNRMSAELEASRAQAEVARADRELAELGEIGRGLAHSLRNPLHALGLSLDALAAGADPDRGAALAAAGRQQLDRIDQALRGFLALSASSGAQVAAVDLGALVDDVLLEASQRAQGRLRFESAVNAAALAGVAAELRIMLHAVVINAVEASCENGVVSLRVEPAGDGVRIAVADRGSGLPPAIRARLFQPHTSGKPTGAGMGLYLAERLARLRYHGSLQLHDREGGGTCAELQLRPREVADGG